MAETNSNSSQLNFFKKLKKDKDTAIVRILHTTPNTYEKAATHRYPVNGKNRSFKCLGDNCPFCKRGIPKEESYYIHVWDYGEPQGLQECIWTRYKIEKDAPQLETIIQNWGKLNNPVLRITRIGDTYPSYRFDVVENYANYADVDPQLVDSKVAYRCFTTRNESEIQTLFDTGVLPDHQRNTSYVPKEQYNQMNNQQKQAFVGGGNNRGNYGYNNNAQNAPSQNYNNGYRQNNYPQNNGYGQGNNYGQNNYQQNGNNTPNPNLNPLPDNTDTPF